MVGAGLVLFGRSFVTQLFFVEQTIPENISEGNLVLDANPTVLAEDLHIPWALAHLPDGQFLISERPGTLLLLGAGGTRIPVEGVYHRGEGGLLGLALHPDFPTNNLLYLYFTTDIEGGTTNRVERYTLEGSTLLDRTTILSNIPGASYHDGGRLAFGPDRRLYITTGDAGVEDSAQDISSLAGKILRINDDGTVPEDNPFGNEVYSYGHRNPQGLAWDAAGRLWSSEHGPSGASSGEDELNLIEPGGNYGWPIIRGAEIKEGMIPPKLQSGKDFTWAPASLAYHDGSLYFGGLRGVALFEARLEGEEVTQLSSYFRGEYGRIRDVSAVDGMLYFTTSNTDGRGNPKEEDDKLISITFLSLK